VTIEGVMLAESIRKEASYYKEEVARLYEHPALSSAIRAVSAGVSPTTEQILAALAPVFADTSWLVEAGRRWVGHLEGDELHFPPVPGALADGGSDVIKTALIFKNERVVIALQCFDSRALALTRSRLAVAGHVILTGRTTMTRVVNDAELACALVDFDPLAPTSDLDVALGLRGAREIGLDMASPPLVVDGRASAMRFLDSARNPLVLSATILAEALPFRCTVDTATGSILSVQAARDVDNMARAGMTVLRQLEDPARDELLRKFFGHEAHFVRWHAMREYAGMHGAAAIPALRQALAAEASAYVRRGIESLIGALEQ
jgi:hypothetical protein